MSDTETPVNLPKGSSPKRAYRKITAKETWKIVELLNYHCKKQGDFAIYDEGWNDATIAEEAIGADYPGNKATAVGNVRLQLIGIIKRYNPTPANNVQRLEECESKILRLELELSELKGVVGRYVEASRP